MITKYYIAKCGNFGDDINGYLWKEIFGDEMSSDPGVYFFGIGTMLFESYYFGDIPRGAKCIIFGSGVRGLRQQIPQSINFEWRFLRGKLSANFVGCKRYISDAAYCLPFSPVPLFDKENDEKIYDISIVPHFSSMDRVNWELFEEKTGIKVISPESNGNPKDVIRMIYKSKFVIAESLHAAIVADIYRIPWIRLSFLSKKYEARGVSDFKWNDWASSVAINKIPTITINNNMLVKLFFVDSVKFNTICLLRCIKSLYKYNDFIHSDDVIYTQIINKIGDEIDCLKNDYFK